MSKTAANIASALIDLTTLPLGKRQRAKTRARIAGKIQQGYDTVETPYGGLKLLGGRSSTIASTVANWAGEEPETRYWIENYFKTDDIFWDIGANIGVFTLYAAQAKGLRIFAFEPSALNFALLSEHLALNGLGEKVTALPVAFSDHAGLETLYFKSAEPGAACNALNEAHDQFNTFTPQLSHAVPVFTVDKFIDTYALQIPTHIKLDVDGIEKLILKGAANTLKSIQTLMIEIEGQNENDPEIMQMIRDAGLRTEHGIEGMGNGRNRLFVR